MGAVKPRTRAVIFRITQAEYEFLKSECSAHGARSLSDFARTKVLRAGSEPSLVEMGRKLNQLEAAVQHLAETLKPPELGG